MGPRAWTSTPFGVVGSSVAGMSYGFDESGAALLDVGTGAGGSRFWAARGPAKKTAQKTARFPVTRGVCIRGYSRRQLSGNWKNDVQARRWVSYEDGQAVEPLWQGSHARA